MKKSELKSLIKECVKEVITEAEDMVTYQQDGKTRKIKRSSALSYPKDHPAYKAAVKTDTKQTGKKPSAKGSIFDKPTNALSTTSTSKISSQFVDSGERKKIQQIYDKYYFADDESKAMDERDNAIESYITKTYKINGKHPKYDDIFNSLLDKINDAPSRSSAPKPSKPSRYGGNIKSEKEHILKNSGIKLVPEPKEGGNGYSIPLKPGQPSGYFGGKPQNTAAVIRPGDREVKLYKKNALTKKQEDFFRKLGYAIFQY